MAEAGQTATGRGDLPVMARIGAHLGGDPDWTWNALTPILT
jgi:hypothetical protein